MEVREKLEILADVMTAGARHPPFVAEQADSLDRTQPQEIPPQIAQRRGRIL